MKLVDTKTGQTGTVVELCAAARREIVVEHGVPWKVLPSGNMETTTPGEDAREILRLQAVNSRYEDALCRIADAPEAKMVFSDLRRMAVEALGIK